MHAHDSFLLDPLEGRSKRLTLIFSQLGAPSKLSEPGNNQVSNLVELGVAGDQEHVSGDTVAEHLASSDAIITEGKEDPRDVGLDVLLIDYS